MDILGPDLLVFGVTDVPQARQYVRDFGLIERPGDIYEAMDGTGIVIRAADDPTLPAPIAAPPNLREVIYGCVDQQTVDAVANELSRDREVRRDADGVIHSTDDDGYHLAFQVTRRHAIEGLDYGINVPGLPAGRRANKVGAVDDDRPKAHTLSHVVLFTKDKRKAERFYNERLQFRTVDEFTNLGPFLRPKANPDHHTLFLIETGFVGIEHFAFHVAGANELLKAGWEFAQKGYKSVWGPGRHIMGSNYFWYFNSPFGGKMEFDADMDVHDDSWEPRRVAATPATAQIFHFDHADKYIPRPGGPAPG